MPKAPKLIHFGGVDLDPVAIGSQGNAILGIRDSGKTYTAMAMAEGLFDAGIPFIAFDPIGVWRFMRVPGAGKGYPIVVAGGVDGDLPLTPAAVPALVEAAMKNGVSLVLDLFDVNLSKADWRKIVMSALRTLLHHNHEHGLRHVFIEEAAEFAPQKVMDGHVYAEMEKLARMGGNARLGYTLINQRSEEVNKALLELCDNLFLHRQKGRNSLTALSKWLDIGNVTDHKEIIATLSTLPTGECWAWPEGSDTPVRIKVPTKNSMHPDRRVMRGDGVKLAKRVDVGQFVEGMRATLGSVEAEAKANDPKLLKAEILRLTKQLADKPQAATVGEAALKAAYDQGQDVGYAAGRVSGMFGMLGLMRERMAAALGDGEEVAKEAETKKGSAPPSPAPSKIVGALEDMKKTRLVEPVTSTLSVAVESDAVLSNAQKSVLKSLRWWKAMGKDSPSRVQVAVICGWSPNSSNIRDRIGELTRAGLIDKPQAGHVSLTTAGLAAAPDPDADTTIAGSIRQILTNAQRAIFDIMLKHGAEMARDDLAEKAGWSANSSNIRDRVGELTRLEIFEKPRVGFVALADWIVR